jgi:hypothetical protein
VIEQTSLPLDASDPVKDLKRNIALLLNSAGNRAICRGCKADIYWLNHTNGKKAPYDLDGGNHFATCPNANEFKNRARTQ